MNSSPKAWCASRRVALMIGLTATAWSISPAFASSPMVTGGLTSQPIGHYEFCKINPSECSIRSRNSVPERVTGSLWKTLVAVNLEVNRAVTPMNDFDIYGKDEVWAYPDNGVGDCEDYVLEKRRQLIHKGLSVSNLLITVVRKPDGEGHAVLTVRTDKGDFVLDNLTDTVRQWDETGYRFLKRQASDHTGHWVTIREGQAPLVGAVQ
ncbi:transglutaminase-like cysteine peptidase [Mesorhizobium sp. CGMCC 1.15528]|uniref:Transglutaminase-like cysteine peptidase n=1 Tax=Mesorhizobium zhangyense TaxID=1776730 RepID=A0A7C9RA31_9HYPH|nr:transglutaminase-like cysteine peptidase [Mesorhizobium zhangyense]